MLPRDYEDISAHSPLGKVVYESEDFDATTGHLSVSPLLSPLAGPSVITFSSQGPQSTQRLMVTSVAPKCESGESNNLPIYFL